MRKKLIILLLFFKACSLFSQQNVDSLRQVAATGSDDEKVKSDVRLASYYRWTIPDSSIYFAIQGLPIAKRIRDEENEQRLYNNMAEALSGKGNFAFALEAAIKSQQLAEKGGDPETITWAIVSIGNVYFYSHDYKNALLYYKRLKNYLSVYADNDLIFSAFIGETYFHLGELDSALAYIGHSYMLSEKKDNVWWPVPYYYMGKIYAAKRQFPKALESYRKGLAISNLTLSTIEGYNGIAELFEQINKHDSAIHYAGKSLALANSLSFANKAIESSAVLRDAYKKIGITDSAFKYQEIMLAAKDSIYSQEKVKQLQNLAFNEQIRLQELAAEREAHFNRIKIYGLIAAGIFFLIISLILLRNNRNKQKAYTLLQSQKEKTEKALAELKITQTQLIQSEKMASLGELTAGIAHEIQNPLNFVNNFSDVNTELIEELNTERLKPSAERNEQLENEILNNIKENDQKINHHGKRADAIVKGMLQHSRTSSGQKEPTDINALAEEYLRLSYHGLRAKDKTFNATTKTNFDNTIGKINVVPQEIGRVILNLINNAFYTVNEKQKQNLNGYEPTVTVSTAKHTGRVEIRVKDNGNGIPQKNLDKIFQPFFTTKPTGQGTGLGLSLSYDIITKGHGGEMKVETKEGEYSEFIIILPV
jgi:signal transduction histidine kinase